MHVSVQRVALEPVRGLLVEFYWDPATSCGREPWSEAPAGFRVILRSPFWKEIKGGEGSRSQVQSCCRRTLCGKISGSLGASRGSSFGLPTVKM